MSVVKKKVFFLVPSTVGGAERVTVTIAKSLPKDKFEVSVVFVDQNRGDLGKFIPPSLRTVTLGIKRMRDFASFRILLFLMKEKPYAVFSSLQYLNVRLPLIARIAGIEKIIIRNDIGWSHWNSIYKKMAHLDFRFTSAIICQTPEMRQEFCDAFPNLHDKIMQIPNPLDVETIQTRIKDSATPYSAGLNFVYVGRISFDKGIDTLIKAFADVCKKKVDAYLTLVGDYTKVPEYYRELKSLIEKHDLSKHVVFVGFQKNPYKYIKYSDCLVLPSRREGNPNILHEAMWIGVPVVATKSVPVVSRIVDTDRGIVVDVDDEKALADAMLSGCEMKIVKPYNYRGGIAELVELFD